MKFKNITITKRNDNRYQTKIVEDNKTKYIYGNNEKDCYSNYLTYLQENFTEDNITTFQDWITKWLSIYKSTNKVSTNESIRSLLKNYAVKFFDMNIKEIKPIMLINQINELINQNKIRQAQKLFTVYKDIFDKALKNDLIKSNPMSTIKKPRYKATEKEALTLGNENMLLKLIENSEFEDIIKFCLYQGTRIGEALALTYEDIDFNKKKININKSLDAKNRIGTPKTADSIRTIPLFDKTLEVLNINGKDRIFNFNYDNIQKFLRDISKKNNIQLTSHTLRHTFATRCIESGVNVKQVSKWLGHSNINITSNIYTHINEDYENMEIKLVNNRDLNLKNQ